MLGRAHRIIVIGTSAGGMQALDALTAQLHVEIPAPIFIVQHMAPEGTGDALLRRLSKNSALQVQLATDGEGFEQGRIYIAPPDNHLLLKKGKILVTKGARENRYRPSIDPLFRSAAVAYGPAVIGVVLTGLLDDGTAGLMAVKKCGGITVVQDPKDAAYPDMPQSVLNNTVVDYCVPLSAMGPLLEKLASAPPGKVTPIPDDVRIEATIAERVLSDVRQVQGLGEQVPYNCPNCGGVLWQTNNPEMKRYRCHTGHSFTAAALINSQSERIEETLWTALRMFEERKNLLNNMAAVKTRGREKKAFSERAHETQVHIERIRQMLLSSTAGAKASKSLGQD